jgi:dual specificity tyrosine-phosphorylation-regulated kinase 2/3/4
VDESKDSWLVYEVGKQALGSLLFDVKGEFFRGERIYNVIHKEFYTALSQDFVILKDFLRLMAEVLDSLQEKKVVHADLKPDNILIEISGRRITSLKLIDFGSSFSFEETTSITATTPEYLAPEVLLFLENRGASNSSQNQTSLFKMQKPWSYDMWSLGAILLEILSGIPIWMSLKCRTMP